MKQVVLVISFSFLDRDPRVTRQLQFLSKKYKVIAMGYTPPHLEDIQFISIQHSPKSFLKKICDGIKLYTKQYEAYYWNLPRVKEAIEKGSSLKPDIVIANDLDALPLGYVLAKGAQVICDAHEYAPKEFEENILWRTFLQKYKTYLCQEYLPKVDKMMTVCEGIARAYSQEFGVNCSVVTNAPYFSTVKRKICEHNSSIRMIFHGMVDPSRKIEKMIEVMNFVDSRFELDLILIPGSSSSYFEKIRKMAMQHPKIRILPAVPMNQIVNFCSQYDIGLYLIEPSNFNNKYCLPNKFFEFIQAKLAIAIGPSVEMAKIVLDYECGIVSADFSSRSIANALNQLSWDKINHFKQNSEKAAQILCAEKNQETFLKLME